MAAAAPSARPGAEYRSMHFSGHNEGPSEEKVRFSGQRVDELAICASPGLIAIQKNGKSRKKDTALERASKWIVHHQIGISLTFFAVLNIVHRLVPSKNSETRKFFELSYYNPRNGKYGAGLDDVYFLTSWFMIWTGVRVAFMDYVATPLAKKARITTRKDQVRFAEQAWMFVSYIASFGLGLHLVYNSEYWHNLDALWANWPERELDSLFKWYYLVEISFWLQQIVVLNIEERRKDHLQMFTHHIVTCSLLYGSYVYHQTKVGNLILCLMDTVDFILALAKMLRYMGLQFACDCAFGVFIVGWIVTRHVIYNMVLWNVFTRCAVVTNVGCYHGSGEDLVGPFDPPDSFWYLSEPFKVQSAFVCMTERSTHVFLGLLLVLQAILLVWFGEIVRLAWKVVVKGGNADDPRSDDEDEVEEDEVEEAQPKQDKNGHVPEAGIMLEEEVGVEQMHFRSKPVVRSKNGGMATSVQLPVKKELLNRVGCDTKTTK